MYVYIYLCSQQNVDIEAGNQDLPEKINREKRHTMNKSTLQVKCIKLFLLIRITGEKKRIAEINILRP